MSILSKKNLITLSAILILLAIAINLITKIFSGGSTEYISHNSNELSYADVREYIKKTDFSGNNSEKYFNGSLINNYTLKFFKYLQERFNDTESIRKYLYGYMESEKADQLLELYKKYLDYEKRLAVEINNNKNLKTTGDLISVLAKMRRMQVEAFGEKDADILFGASLKSQEYPIRRAGIVNDQSLYGKEKEERIRKLNKDMWGGDTEEIEKDRKPYSVYTEKLATYSKDFSEMTEADKLLKVKQFRNEIFPPDVVKRLDEADRSIEEEKQKELAYSSSYKEIMNNKELSEEEKKEKILILQNSIFGEEADAVRRMEKMEAGRTELLKKQGTD